VNPTQSDLHAAVQLTPNPAMAQRLDRLVTELATDNIRAARGPARPRIRMVAWTKPVFAAAAVVALAGGIVYAAHSDQPARTASVGSAAVSGAPATPGSATSIPDCVNPGAVSATTPVVFKLGYVPTGYTLKCANGSGTGMFLELMDNPPLGSASCPVRTSCNAAVITIGVKVRAPKVSYPVFDFAASATVKFFGYDVNIGGDDKQLQPEVDKIAAHLTLASSASSPSTWFALDDALPVR